MTDVWSERAEAFRESPTHKEGPDLDLLVEWCEPGDGVQALDVATGGGHVARRLQEAGCDVVSVDPAPGMRPTVVAPAEHLPFADGSFDVVACRIAPPTPPPTRPAKESPKVPRLLSGMAAPAALPPAAPLIRLMTRLIVSMRTPPPGGD